MLRRSGAEEALWRKILSTFPRTAGSPALTSGTNSQETGLTTCLSVKTGVLRLKALGTIFWEDGSGAATLRLDPGCISRRGFLAEGWTSAAESADRFAQTPWQGNRFRSATRPRSNGSIPRRIAHPVPRALTQVAPVLAMPDEILSRAQVKLP